MIKFRKRDIGCWRDPRLNDERMEIIFNSEEEVLDYVREKLPFTREPTDTGKILRISECKSVCWWTCIGWIEE